MVYGILLRVGGLVWWVGGVSVDTAEPASGDDEKWAPGFIGAYSYMMPYTLYTAEMYMSEESCVDDVYETDGEKHSEPAVLVWISGRIHVCAKCICVCEQVCV